MIRDELKAEFLLNAYAHGYFPMPDPDSENLLWFRPDPRAYFPLDTFRPSRSLRKTLRREEFRFSMNVAFSEVMDACSERPDTWINEEFKEAYLTLHQLGFSHSVEVWHAANLVGGLYGVQIGGVFCAESKFHTKTDASKAALWCLIDSMAHSGLQFLEVQFMTDHLLSLGAKEINDEDYQKKLREHIPLENKLRLGPTWPKFVS